MKKLIEPRKMLLFVTLPQTALAVSLSWLLAATGSDAVMAMLIGVFAACAAFTIYALLRYHREAGDKAVYIALAAVYAVTAVASVPLLENSLSIGGVSVRLLSLLLCAVPVVGSLFALASFSGGKADIVRYITGIVAVPLVFFIAFNVAIGVGVSTVAILLIIAAVFIVALLLIKTLMLRKNQPLDRAETSGKRRIVLFAIFSLALPLIGLALNLSMNNLVGDFSHPVFFIVPVVNGILLLMRPFADWRLRLLCFFLTAAATTYLIYFFVVFLPYLPIGFYGLIILLGAFMFTPAAALVMQIVYLVREWPQVAKASGAKRTLLVFVAGLMLLPAIVLTGFVGDRHNFDMAASYLESSEAASGEPVDLAKLRRALDNANSDYRWSDDLMDPVRQDNTPIISAVYAQVVFGDTALQQEKVERLEKLFFNQYDTEETTKGLTINENDLTTVSLTDVGTQTVYDAEMGAYRTWVNLTLQGSPDEWDQEYVAGFSLPDGAYISDYYLDVAGKRKYGILADDRAAMAVYKDIVEVKRDPGIIHYTGDNELELRVFPFSENEIRHTGFEIIHAFPLSFSLGGQMVNITAGSSDGEFAADGGVLISADFKKTLPRAQTRPQRVYFVVDCSEGSDIGYQVSQIEDYAALSGIDTAKVMFASYRLSQTDLAHIGEADVTSECGFNLALAVKTILTENGDATIPIILFTTQNEYGAVFPEYIAALAKQYPETRSYYQLNADMTLTPYDLETGEKSDKTQAVPVIGALSYRGQRVADDGLSELVLAQPQPQLELSGNQYRDALAIAAVYKSDASRTGAETLKLLRASFRAHMLTPETAFIVVETNAQEAQLYELQEQLLSEYSEVAARETLAEPSELVCLVVVAMGIGIWIVWRNVKTKRKKVQS